jgi:small-conductance mechanosensitive channel
MEKYTDPAFLTAHLTRWWTWLTQSALTFDTLFQIVAIGLSLLMAILISRPLVRLLQRYLETQAWRYKMPGRMLGAFLPLASSVLAILFFRIAARAFAREELPFLLIDTAARLLTAWIIIRTTSVVIRDSNWARTISITAWVVAALHILNLLGPTIDLLDQLAIDLGGVRISVLLMLKGVIVFSLLLKLASTAAGLMEKRIYAIKELTPSVQVLLSKALTITFMTVAVVVAFSTLGINLSAFAFIGGAIGVGIGFGLQKVVSNLISGVILLLDKSIKPGDVIEVGQSYGRIQSLGARYVSVATRDGFEYLIPNEDLITHQVINWSFSDVLVRLKIGVGVAYDTDVRAAMALMKTAACETPRVLDNPAPVCQLKNFGDNAIDLELRVWISDPDRGVANVSSAVRLAIWDAFQAHGIEIPYPQRDVHIKSTLAGAAP